MKLSTHIKTAIRNLTASRLRTLLAMIGIMVGTASVVALISGGQLATQQALEQLKSLGTDLMRVNFRSNPNQSTIKLDTVMAMKTSIAGIREVAPIMVNNVAAYYQKQSFDFVPVVGATESLADVIHISIKSGRFISDLDKNQHFAVLGNELLKKINSINLMGQHIRVGNAIFTIIGIANPWPENTIVGQNINNAVIIPFKSLEGVVSRVQLDTVLLRLNENTNIDKIKQAITDYADNNLPGYRADIVSSKELLNRMAKQQRIFTLLLGLIGSIALLVGGIGVMNIMLASVAERHSEIGLRIALGAEPRDVQLMFLMEAATLAILGGILGVIIGILTTIIIARFANWPFVFLIWPPVIGFSVSLLISLFFGFYPAYVASKLNPIETLHA